MAVPAVIGSISIIIGERPPLPLRLPLRRLPSDWLLPHSTVIYKLPRGSGISLPLLSFRCQGLTSMCVFHVSGLVQRCANTKELRAVEGLIGTKMEKEIFDMRKQAPCSFTCKCYRGKSISQIFRSDIFKLNYVREIIQNVYKRILVGVIWKLKVQIMSKFVKGGNFPS